MSPLKSFLLLICLSAATLFSQNTVQIPNVFTPDDDGVNDIFRITSSGYEGLTCSIFNRHGEVVYRFYGLNGSWDAFTHAGVKVSAGTYFVLVEFSLPDGTTETLHSTLQVQY